jgi:hypothetical protein
MLVPFWITNCPAAVSESEIELESSMTLSAKPFVSAAAMSLRNALSDATLLNIFTLAASAIRGSNRSRTKQRDLCRRDVTTDKGRFFAAIGILLAKE